MRTCGQDLGAGVCFPLVVLTLSYLLASLVWQLCGSPVLLLIPSIMSERSVFRVWKRGTISQPRPWDLVTSFLLRAVVVIIRAMGRSFIFPRQCALGALIASTTASLARLYEEPHHLSCLIYTFSCHVSERPFQTCLH